MYVHIYLVQQHRYILILGTPIDTVTVLDRLVDMELKPLTRDNATSGICAEGIDASVLATVDVTSLDAAGLDARLRDLGRVQNRVSGLIAQVVAEKKRRSRVGDTVDGLLEGLRMSKGQARKTMNEATQLEKLEATRDALVASKITPEHARIMGTASENGPLDETKMLAAAKTETPDQFRKTMRDHQNELAGDDGEARHERQRQDRTASFTERDDGMWQLFALFDPIAAARIRKTLNAETDAKWRFDNQRGRDHISDRHRRADALEQLITRNVGGNGTAQPQSTTLLLMANYDLVDNKLGNPRLADGTPLPPSEFHKLACDADILCGLFREADTEPIWLGSTTRHPNFALRAALEARDGGCIGCQVSPEWCVSHHIIEWQHDGPTQPDNLVLLCHDCHDKVHHQDWTVEEHPDTARPYLRPPWQKPPKPPDPPLRQ